MTDSTRESGKLEEPSAWCEQLLELACELGIAGCHRGGPLPAELLERARRVLDEEPLLVTRTELAVVGLVRAVLARSTR